MIRCFIDNQEIDLVYESQIAISLSIASVTQVETGRTGYSKTIRVPMTVRNNSILGNAAEIHSPEMFTHGTDRSGRMHGHRGNADDFAL